MGGPNNLKPKNAFKSGQPRPPNAGRKAGTPNKVTSILKDAFLLAAEQLGEPYQEQYEEEYIAANGQKKKRIKTRLAYSGIDGVVGYLRWMGLQHVPVFGSGLVRVMPLQVNVDNTQTRTFRTVEEIRAEIIKRGLPLDARLLEPPPKVAVSENVIDVEAAEVREELRPLKREHLSD